MTDSQALRSWRKLCGTVHAIAMANLCELVAGTPLDSSRDADRLPADVSAEAIFPPIDGNAAQDLAVPVSVTDGNGKPVVRAEITMYVSPKK